MSKALYLGVNGVARKGKKAYIGVSGVAHKIKKMYVGDASGKARLCYSGGPSDFHTIVTGLHASSDRTSIWRMSTAQNPSNFTSEKSLTSLSNKRLHVVYVKPKRMFLAYPVDNDILSIHNTDLYTMPIGGNAWTAKRITRDNNYAIYVSIKSKWYVDQSTGYIYYPSHRQSGSMFTINRLEIKSDGTLQNTSANYNNIPTYESNTYTSSWGNYTKVNGRYFLHCSSNSESSSCTQATLYATSPMPSAFTSFTIPYTGRSQDSGIGGGWYTYIGTTPTGSNPSPIDYCNGKWFTAIWSGRSGSHYFSISYSTNLTTWDSNYYNDQIPVAPAFVNDHKMYHFLLNAQTSGYMRAMGVWYFNLQASTLTPTYASTLPSGINQVTDVCISDDLILVTVFMNSGQSKLLYSTDGLSWTDAGQIFSSSYNLPAYVARGIE